MTIHNEFTDSMFEEWDIWIYRFNGKAICRHVYLGTWWVIERSGMIVKATADNLYLAVSCVHSVDFCHHRICQASLRCFHKQKTRNFFLSFSKCIVQCTHKDRKNQNKALWVWPIKLLIGFILAFFLNRAALHCKEYPIYVFLFWELRSLNFHIHVSVSDLHIPRISPHIWLQQNRQTDPGNIKISHRYMSGIVRENIKILFWK